MLNEHLLQQVREGKAAIKHTKKVKDREKLNKVISECFSEVRYIAGMFGYYFASTAFEDGWDNDDMPPTGLTPIPLDDFFKEEERPECICKTKPHMACLVHDYPDLPSYVTPTPEQPSLPEGKGVGVVWVNVINGNDSTLPPPGGGARITEIVWANGTKHVEYATRSQVLNHSRGGFKVRWLNSFTNLKSINNGK